MIRIAHRGNIFGPLKEKENTPDYVRTAINKGFNAESDFRYIDGTYYMGHDYPLYVVDLEFLKNEKLWCHAKDGPTLRQMLKDGIHCFFENDGDRPNYVLTSRNLIWHWDGKSNIYVLDSDKLIGICSDYVGYLNDTPE